jgi:predicted DCC family thiol-disulfide oxidoreductase YuxK
MEFQVNVDPKILERLNDHGLVLYDGECGLCEFSVQFILKRDHKKYFLFAPLQSQLAKSILKKNQDPGADTVFLFENEKVFEKSQAALKIASKLSFPWNLLNLAKIIPKWIRDFFYDVIAKNRKKFFPATTCRIPKPGDRARFLN